MWKEGVVEIEDNLLGSFSLTIKFKNLTDDFRWVSTCVYGASYNGDYKQFWAKMNDIRILFYDPWVVGGDLNAILFQSERNKPGGCLTSRIFLIFFVGQHSLIDFSLN